MFNHICKTCGNIFQALKADFEHVCHVCGQVIAGVMHPDTGELVTKEQVNAPVKEPASNDLPVEVEQPEAAAREAAAGEADVVAETKDA